MKYDRIVEGAFVERPNRFIAYVDINGKQEVVHVKNTGRCKELLLPGAKVYLEEGKSAQRKTPYDLVAVEKQTSQGMRLINMDSQAPNKVVEEWLWTKELFQNLFCVRPEKTYGKSRFDFYVEYYDPNDAEVIRKAFIEVKGVTLERDGAVLFPDAPSERAVKHVEELVTALDDGYEAYIIFVIQMKGVDYFMPNDDTHPEFAQALKKAADAGAHILAYDCDVEKDALMMAEQVPVYLTREELEISRRKQRLSAISEPLLAWYDKHRRTLPWREDPTPYHVWVSEIMLQQTRVEAVKPYYKRFMEELPDISSLAYAEEQKLLKLWEGLGYYSRVRNLQKAAVQIMEEYGGEMPDRYETLIKLQGIGSYTAGAIASIAYGRSVPAVDGNVLRVVSRLCMDEDLITDVKVKQRVEAQLKETMSKSRPGDFNQAMMEIGAMVCIPNGAPHCEECPLNHICLAHERNREEEFPKKAAKKPRTIEEKTILLIQDADKAAIHQRPRKGLLAGLYEFPALDGYKTAEEVISYLSENGLKPLRIQPLPDSKHIFTHKEWHMRGYQIRVDELEPGEPGKDAKTWLFVEPENTQKEYPIPSAFAAYVPYLNIKLGKDNFE